MLSIPERTTKWVLYHFSWQRHPVRPTDAFTIGLVGLLLFMPLKTVTPQGCLPGERLKLRQECLLSYPRECLLEYPQQLLQRIPRDHHHELQPLVPLDRPQNYPHASLDGEDGQPHVDHRY